MAMKALPASPARPAAVPALLRALLLLASASAQLKILAPESLTQEFPETHGIVYGTTATFGAPYYGERVLGQLLYGESKGRNHCDEEDYDISPSKASSSGAAATSGERGAEEAEVVNVVLVRRGSCTFVTKVRVAQKKEAHAVVVVDKEDSTLDAEQIQKIVMADDGWGSKIRIPSILISRLEGQKLIDAARLGRVMVELAWDIPRGQVVVADFWMSAASRESREFLERFKDCAETLQYSLQFVPHFHVFSLPSGASYNHLCVEAIEGCDACRPVADKFCAPDPDGPGPITGGAVANEDLRQLCIWNTTARRATAGGAFYSQEYWDYVVRFIRDCPLEERDASKRFGYECSLRAMEKVGVQWDKVQACIRRNHDEFLNEQIAQVAWSPQALRLNGWRYSGPLDPETVLKAVCSGYAEVPAECGELLSGLAGPLALSVPQLSLGGLLSTMAVMVMALAGVFVCYRRHVTKSVRQVLREEVMLEVQTQMADYVPFEDSGPGGRGGAKPLSF